MELTSTAMQVGAQVVQSYLAREIPFIRGDGKRTRSDDFNGAKSLRVWNICKPTNQPTKPPFFFFLSSSPSPSQLRFHFVRSHLSGLKIFLLSYFRSNYEYLIHTLEQITDRLDLPDDSEFLGASVRSRRGWCSGQLVLVVRCSSLRRIPRLFYSLSLLFLFFSPSFF